MFTTYIRFLWLFLRQSARLSECFQRYDFGYTPSVKSMWWVIIEQLIYIRKTIFKYSQSFRSLITFFRAPPSLFPVEGGARMLEVRLFLSFDIFERTSSCNIFANWWQFWITFCWNSKAIRGTDCNLFSLAFATALRRGIDHNICVNLNNLRLGWIWIVV